MKQQSRKDQKNHAIDITQLPSHTTIKSVSEWIRGFIDASGNNDWASDRMYKPFGLD